MKEKAIRHHYQHKERGHLVTSTLKEEANITVDADLEDDVDDLKGEASLSLMLT